MKTGRFSSKGAMDAVISIPFVVASSVFVLWLAWQILSLVNFSYPIWYQVLDIDQHIEKYAPQNYNRDNFASTSIEERYRLFGQVVEAINRGGSGLAEITYHDISGQPIDAMYTPAEVQHLQDVANLISVFDYAAYISLALMIIYASRFLGFWGGQAVKPDWRTLHYSVLGLVGLSVVAILIIGPKKVFYFAHELVFPADHPWFFYYQESLMSTSMKAPDLFAGLAVEWLVVTLMCYYIWIYLFSYLVKKRIRLTPVS